MTVPSVPLISTATSRSLPLLDRPIDNTALSAYMTCPKLFDYSMRQHRRSRGRTRPALAMGSGLHIGLETLYKVGTDERARERGFTDLMEYVEAAITAKWQDHDSPDDYRTLDRCIRTLRQYVEHYGPPHREEAKTVGWPDEPMVEISTEITWPGAAHPYAVKIDRIIESQGQYYVDDHKSSSQFGASFFQQFTLKNQMAGYAYVAQQILGKPIAGVRINALIVRKTNTEFARQTIAYSQAWLKAWAVNYNFWIQRIETDYAVHRGLVESGASPEEIDLWSFPRNFNACDGKYGMCQYVGVCSMPPNSRLRALEQDFPDTVPWNPLDVEEDDA